MPHLLSIQRIWGSNDPWSYLLTIPQHDSGTPRDYGHLAKKFLDLNLQQFGITVEDFFDLPRSRAEILIKAAEAHNRAKNKEFEEYEARNKSK